MDVDTTALHQELIEWIEDWNDGEAAVTVTADTPLLTTGLLDSMGMVAYLSFLEDRTGRSFDLMTFTAGRSATIRDTVDHCLKK
jgi:acyl carrier protein